MNTPYVTIPASTLDSDYPLLVTPAKIKDRETVQGRLEAWRHKADGMWPPEITVETLMSQLHLLYVAHWLTNGYGWCDWRGEEHKGKSQHYQVVPHSGVATLELTEHCAVNLDKRSGLTGLHCGPRDEHAPRLPLERDHADKLHVLTVQPNWKPEDAVREELNRALHKKAQAAAMALNAMSSLEIGPAHVERVSATQWLYPVYLGRYPFKGQELGVQIDALTGEVYIEPPAQVKRARLENGLIALLALVALLIIVAAALLLARPH